MNIPQKNFFVLFFLLLRATYSLAQPRDLHIEFHSDIPSTCAQMTVTMMHDILGQPYLYVAQKEGGLKIYDINSINMPVLMRAITIDQFDSLHVMNLTQSGNYLYLALGNHFGTSSQAAGVAIVDISTPSNAVVTAFWKNTQPDGGAGIVAVEGNYAYLGAMKYGLITLDISNKQQIKFVSQFIPDLAYPDAKPDTSKYNARGMVVKNDIVYLCFDAGGLRIINVADKTHPKETGRYSNPAVTGRPRAYNNIVVDDSLAYIAVDYCGMEILNVSDAANIKLTSWWNPWNCTEGTGLNWFGSAGHANEICFNKECKLIFLSTGKSDMYAVDVSDPSHPDSTGIYGGTSNNLGTWGINFFQNQIYLSYICAVIPFASNWTGVKILKYNNQCNNNVVSFSEQDIHLYPNPSSDVLYISLNDTFLSKEKSQVAITNLLGEIFLPTQVTPTADGIKIALPPLTEGTYLITITDYPLHYTAKFIKTSQK